VAKSASGEVDLKFMTVAADGKQRRRKIPPTFVVAAIFVACCAVTPTVRASTYVVNIPLDSPIYEELSTLDGLGYLDTYFPEVRPISRVEAARLVVEAETNLKQAEKREPLAETLTANLRSQLHEEVGWIENDTEDVQPTTFHPIDRIETQYIFSSGARRQWLSSGPRQALNATEGTPLLPNNDGLPTASGSNEIFRVAGWGGFDGFLTGYAEGAVSGPFTRGVHGASPGQLLGAEAVVSLGNVALSFGQEERGWGTGYFAQLSNSANTPLIPALTLQNIHPGYLPWILRYLGPGRRATFFGQLDAIRPFAQHPWIFSHVMAFKPLPGFEIGMTRTILFGGRNNDHYDNFGFLGRMSGIATGLVSAGNTKSRAGVFLKFTFPSLRNLQLYQEIAGSDNLTFEVPTLGHYLPFLNVAYQGGFYLPRLTKDGLTDLRLEYALIPPGYGINFQSQLYYTYNDALIGDPMGPNSSEVDLQLGRWIDLRYKASVDFFYTSRSPGIYEGNERSFFQANSPFYPYGPLTTERSGGVAFDLLRLPQVAPFAHGARLDGKARLAFEYVNQMNYGGPSSFRTLLLLSVGFAPDGFSFTWHQ
jgi:hypothetical protein